MAIFVILTFGYYDFIHPSYKQDTHNNLQLIFHPDIFFEKEWNKFQSPERPDFDIVGRTKIEFMKSAKNA